jgi:hypothetical protein
MLLYPKNIKHEEKILLASGSSKKFACPFLMKNVCLFVTIT